ncbi:DUF4124 domain-containing protein [Pleionea mediterranea]|uniref:Uncharacterized protein DUF4124 n=1 Tax=Pleionea mediterranea TaxID=523701 RepID=A0A316G0K2_9GAMM|nr:DUF4124 domain-containing protein [Pleionea mediterranea]PWK47877.1 uncharacterized protein DUF4124 [Pleionea mediterranea]
MTSKCIVTLLFIAFLSSSLHSQSKIYKWRDENGKLHFSSSPPTEQVDHKEVHVNNDIPSGVSIRKTSYYQYCDNIRLPGRTGRPIEQLRGISKNMLRWKKKVDQFKEELRTQNRKVGKYSGEYRSRVIKRTNDIKQSIAKYQCAINWAIKTREVNKNLKADLTVERNQLEVQIASVRTKRELICGKRPKYISGSDALSYREIYERYEKCALRYTEQVKSLLGKKREVKNQINRLK